MCDYNQIILAKRDYETPSNQNNLSSSFESDRGRIINSAIIRRMQQKTQVFPLETNAAVRSRLTHSLEVQQIGRYISKEIIKNLSNSNQSINKLRDEFVSIVEMACLLHDAGNPPFGHLGEEAIKHWAKSQIAKIFNKHLSPTILKRKRYLIKDLQKFEGNAQALRLIHSIQVLNLTYSQIAAIIKYPIAAYKSKRNYKALHKKPGYYYSEKNLINELNQELGLTPGNRYPLTYIMEAADDIGYCIADIEDAVEKNLVDFDFVIKELIKIWKTQEFATRYPKSQFSKLLNKVKNHKNANLPLCEQEKMRIFRNDLTTILVRYAAKEYLLNHKQIFQGSHDQPLFHEDTEQSDIMNTLKNFAKVHVFTNREVEALELKGFHIIKVLLDHYQKLLNLEAKDFVKLVNKNKLSTHPFESRLYHRLPPKHKAAYQSATENLTFQSEEDNALELYYRCRLIIDYVAGMTDQFALEEHQTLTAIQ